MSRRCDEGAPLPAEWAMLAVAVVVVLAMLAGVI